MFFATHEALVAQDTDRAGDIYDARSMVAFRRRRRGRPNAKAIRARRRLRAPSDLTPSSATFQGVGDVSVKRAHRLMRKAKAQAAKKTKKKKKSEEGESRKATGKKAQERPSEG